MDEITVFMALASPLLRIRMRTSLASTQGIRLIGEASTAMAAVEQLQQSAARILLTERALLREPELAALCTQRSAPRPVLISATDSGLAPDAAQPSVRTLPYTLTPAQLAIELRRALIPPAEPVLAAPEMAPGLHERFHITGPLSSPRASGPTAPQPPSRQPQGRRRTPSARQEQLLAALHDLQHHQQRRDAVTGLAGPAALEQVRAFLPTARQAVAFVGIEVQDEREQVMATPPPEAPLLRRLSATLRANVRQEDLVFRTGPASFVVVLPGVRWDEATVPVERIQTALTESCQRQVVAAGARLAVGVSYWEAGTGNVGGSHPQ